MDIAGSVPVVTGKIAVMYGMVPVQEIANAIYTVLYEQVSMEQEDPFARSCKKIGLYPAWRQWCSLPWQRASNMHRSKAGCSLA